MKSIYPWKQAVITGLIVGTFGICSFSIADSLNKYLNWGTNPATIRGICGLLMLIILGTGTYVAMQYVKRTNNGILTYKQALLSGITVALTTGIITAILSAVYCEVINPGYAEYMVAEGKKAMIANREMPAEMAKHIAALRSGFSTGAQVMQAIIGQSVCGTIISLVMGLFVKSKRIN